MRKPIICYSDWWQELDIYLRASGIVIDDYDTDGRLASIQYLAGSSPFRASQELETHVRMARMAWK